uniref:Uncharacterized protein n=1 Tax=Manihot esculenta TaxID=3983 RepID=A0A2C9WHN3_MANES
MGLLGFLLASSFPMWIRPSVYLFVFMNYILYPIELFNVITYA